MLVIGEAMFHEFLRSHSDAQKSLESWAFTVKNENWDTPVALKERFPNVRVIGRGRAIFNIKGNNYRLVVAINYRKKIVQIRFVGTHAEYDRINALEV